ncbi:uncharacterized protein N0V89_010622 [Didymosphaeria variabile]|uniref:Cora-domain-containing protein n=1 Tax=Didymosphaeria variabile TaxID=1932322 RepID=A0A9W8XBZ4_9PLEO|nr:uncharacterized protein N0V89_010622 [Didymosphaeria variabile]KAJ4346690.1 hypothetical protein N0V89_010622 [Didymosphaeria variabile]
MSRPPDDDGGWGSFSVAVAEELPPPPRPPEPAPRTPPAASGFELWKSTTKKKKKGKKGAAVVEEPPLFREMLKTIPSTMFLPPFPEMRRTRAFDDSEGDGLHLIEVGEGTAKETLVTESFIIRSAAKGVNGLTFGATFTYHFPTRHMYAFIHMYEIPPYIDVIPSLASSLSSPNSTPFLIPLFLLHVDAEQRYKFITNAHATLFSLEIQAGVRESANDREETDFTALSKDLSYFIGNLSLVDWACKTMTRQLEFIGEVKKRYRTQATLSGLGEEEIENTTRVMEDGLDSLGCLNKSIEEQTECLSQRAQALIQTVYSGIAQRDAALSQLAANAAARDSAIMRVIAVLTMFFLPATTVATFFSTSFFDFQVTRHEQVYSWWLWLYWVTTVLLTVAVMAATFWWWRKKERELHMAQVFEDDGSNSTVGLRERIGQRVMRFKGLRRNMIENMSDDGR